jgi:hypothetical protein
VLLTMDQAVRPIQAREVLVTQVQVVRVTLGLGAQDLCARGSVSDLDQFSSYDLFPNNELHVC